MGSKPLPGTYSASRCSAIVGLNPYQTRLHIFQILMEENEPGWSTKHGYVLPEFQDSAALRWGSAFEDPVIRLAEERENLDIVGREDLFKKEIGNIILSCHIDGAFAHDEGIMSCCLHEGKTTNFRAFNTIKEEIEENLDEDGQILKGFKLVRRWGEPGTSEVPFEYQVQCAVQRICTGAELVQLSLLVFPKSADDFEEIGWEISKGVNNEFLLCGPNNAVMSPMKWAHTFSEIGNFHTYNLPTHEKLELSIIEAVRVFHENHILAGLPPKAENYDDIKRLMPSPQGTIVTGDNEFKEKCRLYSELVRQTGTKSPNAIKKEKLKLEIMNQINETAKKDWTTPAGKIVVIDSNGGDQLASFSKNKNGQLSFRAKRA